MKIISPEQIQAILTAIYQTNIPVKEFDALKEYFSKLPEIEPSPSEEGKS